MENVEPSFEFSAEVSIREGVVFVNVPPQRLTVGAVFRLAGVLVSAGLSILKDE